jgi:hypothetical protein
MSRLAGADRVTAEALAAVLAGPGERASARRAAVARAGPRRGVSAAPRAALPSSAHETRGPLSLRRDRLCLGARAARQRWGRVGNTSVAGRRRAGGPRRERARAERTAAPKLGATAIRWPFPRRDVSPAAHSSRGQRASRRYLPRNPAILAFPENGGSKGKGRRSGSRVLRARPTPKRGPRNSFPIHARGLFQNRLLLCSADRFSPEVISDLSSHLSVYRQSGAPEIHRCYLSVVLSLITGWNAASSSCMRNPFINFNLSLIVKVHDSVPGVFLVLRPCREALAVWVAVFHEVR